MKEKINKLSFAAAVLAWLGYAVCAVAAGGTVTGLLGFNLCLFTGIVACGDYLKDRLVHKGPLFDNLAISFCLGCMFLFINFIAFDAVGFQRGMIILPLAIGAYNLYRKGREFSADILFVENTWVTYLTFAGFAAAFVLCSLLPFARADKVTNFFVHQDMIWSVGNAASVHLGFPLTDMRFANTTLNYHYLNDVTAGMLAVSSGQPAYESLCFYWYLPVTIILIVSLYQTAREFGSSDLMARFMGFIVIFTTFGGIYHNITNINGQGSATMVLCGGLCMLKLIASEKFSIGYMSKTKKIGFVLASITIGFVISMYKSTIGALFILAVAAACIVGRFTKKTKKEHVIFTVCIALGFGIAYKFIFSLAVNNLVFNGLEGLKNLPLKLWEHAGIGCLIYIPCLVYSLIRFKKLSFLQLVANAMFVGGTVAFNVYYHYSASQVYFILIAVPMMWLANCDFLSKFVFDKKMLGYLFMCVIFAVGLYNSLNLLGDARKGVQAGLRIMNLRLSDYDEANVTADDYEAMLWLRENTRQDEIFATNRNNKYFQAGEGVFHYYTAISQRACFLESYRYCMDYSGMYHEVRRRLEQVSDQIFHVYDEATAFSVAREEGIDYLVVFTPVNVPQWQAEPVFENSTVIIYEV